MTAEPTINDGARLIRKIEACDGIAAKLVLLRQFADKYAAAQLAEKEREIAKLKWDIDQFSQMASRLRELEKAATARAEAAEERLKEAQAKWQLYEREYILPQFGWAKELGVDLQQLVRDNAGKNSSQLFYESLRERLRQREAELEQRWIAVGERLPEYGTCLMVYVYDRKDERKVSWQDLATYSYHGGWSVGSPIEPDLVVTHWQPLPSPPKVQP